MARIPALTLALIVVIVVLPLMNACEESVSIETPRFETTRGCEAQPVMCQDFSVRPSTVGGVDLAYGAWSVAVSASLGLAVAGEDVGFELIDISNPEAPQLLGTIPGSGGFALGIAAAFTGNYLCVAEYALKGFRVIDVSTPSSPQEVAAIDTLSGARGLAVEGDYAYVATDNRFYVVDISTPTSPVVTGWVLDPNQTFPFNEPHGIAVQGNYAYVAQGPGGLVVIDISDPTSPQRIGSAETPFYANDVDVRGNYAYIANGNPWYAAASSASEGSSATLTDVDVVDISDPAAPAWIGGLDLPSVAWGIEFSGDYAYVAARTGDVQVIDITDPGAPMLVSRIDVAGSSYIVSVAIDGGVGCSVDRIGRLNVHDITSSIPGIEGIADTPGYAVRVVVSGCTAFVADQTQGVQVIDVSDPGAPVIIGNAAASSAYGIALQGNYAYAATSYPGALQVVDVTEMTTPGNVGSVAIPDRALDVKVSGDYAFVAAEDSGLQAVDISDPTSPQLVGSVLLPSYAAAIALLDDNVYACADSGLYVVDVSLPNAPQIIARVGSMGAVRDVVVTRQYAYVATASGLHVIDISTPSAPTIVGSAATRFDAVGIALSVDFVYVRYTNYNGSMVGVEAIDVTYPASPESVGWVDTPGSAGRVTWASGYIYACGTSAGLMIIPEQCR